MEGRFIT